MKALLTWLVNTIIRIILHILLKIDASELKKVPKYGPLILAVNHVNFIEVPVLITHLLPRPITGLVKQETWDHPAKAFLFNLWGGIPIDRGIADFNAFKTAKDALLIQNQILAIAPEGSRSEDGCLIQGKPGITILASKSGVPILPIAYYGHESLKHNFRRLKRTPFTIKVGKPFRCKFEGQDKNKLAMQAMTDAIMLEIADLLPDKYHGEYAGVVLDREKYLEYLDLSSGEQIPQAFGKQFSHA
jgi:1-acyl-sn-glycerol-3-phosphate acyltransferase